MSLADDLQAAIKRKNAPDNRRFRILTREEEDQVRETLDVSHGISGYDMDNAICEAQRRLTLEQVSMLLSEWSGDIQGMIEEGTSL